MSTIDLDAIRHFCSTHRIPAISPATERFLQQVLCQHKPMNCVEIGSAVGYSSVYMSMILQAWGGLMYSFEVSYRDYLWALVHAKSRPNLILYPFSVVEIEPKLCAPSCIDMLFIDGQKSQYVEYIRTFASYLHSDSIVVLDDVIQFHNKLDSLYAYLQKNQIYYEILQLEDHDGVMIIEGKQFLREGIENA